MSRRTVLTPAERAWLDKQLQHVTPAYDRATVTFERITWGGGILCLECKACGKRSMLTPETCPQIREGNKMQVRHARFRCSRQDCGSTEVRIYAGRLTREEAEMFVAGDPLDPEREIPEKAGTGPFSPERDQSKIQ